MDYFLLINWPLILIKYLSLSITMFFLLNLDIINEVTSFKYSTQCPWIMWVIMLAGGKMKYSWRCVSFGDCSLCSFWLILSLSFGSFLTNMFWSVFSWKSRRLWWSLECPLQEFFSSLVLCPVSSTHLILPAPSSHLRETACSCFPSPSLCFAWKFPPNSRLRQFWAHLPCSLCLRCHCPELPDVHVFCPFCCCFRGWWGCSWGWGRIQSLLLHIGQKWKFSSLITLKVPFSRMPTISKILDYIVFVMHTVVHSWWIMFSNV